MNRNKEMMVKLCLLCGIWSAVIGINSNLNNKDFNADKLRYEVKEVKIIKIANFEKFMKIVDISKKKIEADKIVKAKKLIEDNKIKMIKAKKLKENKVTASRGGEVEYNMVFTLTFYTNLTSENSSAGGINCRGIKLYDGMVANNKLPYGTKIKLEGWGTVEVLDVGGSNFDVSHRLDVYVPREGGESDNEYFKRVQRMGKVKVQGKIVK
ncbi:hypothetical protein G9F71_008740 [Clostridium sp. FP2]|uniref:hypothetical protein n=1 Tax=Clostridium sp. FP2 TaxID=2724481 RepID=UPI0013E93652|nr:hypothetical protein [Clostridium sp. FP2]MBZ9622940.1 hypothetical protein [Clostridium sp. FP2]